MFLTRLANHAFALWSGQTSPAKPGREDDFPDVTGAPLDSRRLIRDRRYCHVLRQHNDLAFDDVSIDFAWKALQHQMAFVPSGSVRLVQDTIREQGNGYALAMQLGEQTPVRAFYIDKHCVTNSDYVRFVQAGGYEKPELWPQEILPWVLQFVDRSEHPGPKFWSQGSPPDDKLDHPVVGICWYEAAAYARWVGKSLPTPAEWQRAGTWPTKQSADGSEQRYPWGNSFELSRANLWQSNVGATLAVGENATGSTPNGVRQLIGNVWEWVDASYPAIHGGDLQLELEELMAEVRGAAFDTYFTSQATCQFRSAQAVLSRTANVGFRCCVAAADLTPPSTSQSLESL